MVEAVLQLLHSAADAVATASPGRAGGAILGGLNVISRHLRLSDRAWYASSEDPDDDSPDEVGDGSGCGWGTDDGGPDWADEDEDALAPGDGEYGL